MQSRCTVLNNISVPHFEGEMSMIPFNVETLEGLPEQFISIAKDMLKGVTSKGIAYFTAHGKYLRKSGTLRRGGPHTDGNYEPFHMTFGGGNGGWKVGENGPAINTVLHDRQYNSELGGIILVTNFQSAIGWVGSYDALPNVGGDCSHIELGEPFKLEAGKVYYGNNHFIHESLPVSEDVHRVMYRITLPETHQFNQGDLCH